MIALKERKQSLKKHVYGKKANAKLSKCRRSEESVRQNMRILLGRIDRS